MNNNTLLVLGCVAAAVIMFSHDSRKAAPVMAEQSAVHSKFDYGDGVGAAPNSTTPIPSFTATPPVGSSAMGSTPPVVSGVADVTAPGGPSAFSDVSKEEVKDTKPMASTQGDTIPSKITPTPEPMSATKPGETSAFASSMQSGIANYVFPIKCYNYFGSAVAVAPDTLVSAHHVAKYANAQISLSSGLINATVQHPPGADDIYKDAALVKITGGQFPTLKCRPAVYREAVTVYGQATRTPMRGIVVGARTVSLDPNNAGIKDGDSGGAVMADSDGCLVGIISGNEGAYAGFAANNLEVKMTRIDYVLPYLPQASRMASAVPKPVGSVFPDQGAVNTNHSGPPTPGGGFEAFNQAFNQAQRPASESASAFGPQQPTQAGCNVQQGQMQQQQQQFYYTTPHRVRTFWVR